MKTVCFELPTMEQVEFIIEALPEDSPIRGNAIASGNEAEDKEVEDKLIEDLENGNEWAWCLVKVTAKYKGLEGTDYLGACSYANQDDFIKGGYYEDMKETAYKELIQELENLSN